MCSRLCGVCDLNPGQEVESEFGTAPHPHDIVLLTKMYLGSTELSQAPTLCVPHDYLQQLHQDGPQEVVARTPLSSTLIEKFTITANVVSASPYCMTKAAEYLQNLADTSGKCFEPPAIGWIRCPDRIEEPLTSVNAMSLDFMVSGPALVRVQPTTRTSSKRPAVPSAVAGRFAVGDAAACRRVRKKLGPLPADMKGRVLGCSKCTHKEHGCTTCRTKVGLKMDEQTGAWKWPDALEDTSLPAGPEDEDEASL